MDFKGYMIEGTWDGQALTVKGTNKTSHYALVGPDLEEAAKMEKDAAAGASTADVLRQVGGLLPDGSAVVIPREAIASARLKEAGIITNGCLDIRTHDGRRYQLHFLRKHTPAFKELAAALGI